MRVAYLINRYPAASHSFIRREIEAVEAQGIAVVRFSIRPVNTEQLPDKRDQAELAKTTSLLGLGALPLVVSGLARVISAPAVSLKGLKVAFSKCDWKPLEIIRRTAYFLEAALLVTRLRNEGIQHMHAHFGTNSATVARIASILSGIPYSFTVHGPDEFDAPDGLDLAGKVRDCAFCVAISSFGRSQLMRWSAFGDWHKIRVVRCGVDSGFLDGEALTQPPAAPYLCSIARLSAQKGLPLLIEAATELKRRGHSFRLTLVGDGEMRSEIEAMIAARKLEQYVILAGLANSKTVIAHLQQARAMVLPSFAEGLPVVIMEALALGRPVIVSAIAGTPELVTGDCGWLVPAGSVDGLVDAMEDALEALPEQLSAMGQNGRERVLTSHNAAENGRELAALFLEVQQS
jgi:glycosyltransferase involved in cell wall biosynthesis